MGLDNELLFGTMSYVDYACVSPQNQARALEVEELLGRLSAQAHASMAGVALAAAEFDELGGWCDGGIRSFPHWLTINMGFDPHTGKELLRVGHALKNLPLIAAAFAAGQLSFDKVRQITTVATPDTDELMLEIGRGASGSQLERICRSLRRIKELESPGHDQKQLARRGLWTHFDEDGMLRLVAKLPAEDAAVVIAAIESSRDPDRCPIRRVTRFRIRPKIGGRRAERMPWSPCPSTCSPARPTAWSPPVRRGRLSFTSTSVC